MFSQIKDVYDTFSFFQKKFIRINGDAVMNPINVCTNNLSKEITSKKIIPTIILKTSTKNECKILKAFLLRQLHQLFYQLYQNTVMCNQNISMECYTMDHKIIQFLIQSIVETGEYTLEGVARYTRIPFDVIYDVACGINNQFSMTLCIRVIDLYMQVKPDIVKILIDRLLEMKENNLVPISSLLKKF